MVARIAALEAEREQRAEAEAEAECDRLREAYEAVKLEVELAGDDWWSPSRVDRHYAARAGVEAALDALAGRVMRSPAGG